MENEYNICIFAYTCIEADMVAWNHVTVGNRHLLRGRELELLTIHFFSIVNKQVNGGEKENREEG